MSALVKARTGLAVGDNHEGEVNRIHTIKQYRFAAACSFQCFDCGGQRQRTIATAFRIHVYWNEDNILLLILSSIFPNLHELALVPVCTICELPGVLLHAVPLGVEGQDPFLARWHPRHSYAGVSWLPKALPCPLGTPPHGIPDWHTLGKDHVVGGDVVQPSQHGSAHSESWEIQKILNTS